MAQQSEVLIIGGGIAGLTTACLLSSAGIHSTVLEQNWLPGGCASSYPRKHYVFESGATTLVGLSEGMPLHHLIQETGIRMDAWSLEVPMQVHLSNGETLTRYRERDAWIAEAERVFGPAQQRAFWEYCFKVSEFVWDTSLRHRAFPPSNWKDLREAIRNFQFRQLPFAGLAFKSMKALLKQFGLLDHPLFVDFVNEQLLITAQNYLDEVNVLFGATALCYTLYPNYYVPGGLINLVTPMVEYLESRGSQVILREPVRRMTRAGDAYLLEGKNAFYKAPYVVAAIPVNNVLELWDEPTVHKKYRLKTLGSSELNSAFSLGIVFKKEGPIHCLHHQIHLDDPLPFAESASIFLSLSHPEDDQRCGPDEVVASVSTHVHHPDKTFIEDKERVCHFIFDVLEERGFLKKENIVFYHASTPKAWKKWTGRTWGFVGGYPQYMRIKPWQMLDARLDHKGAYICGDSTYPGQGIPGACLSGIIAFEKMKLDGVLARVGEKSDQWGQKEPVF